MSKCIGFIIVFCIIFSLGCQEEQKSLTDSQRAAIEKAVLAVNDQIIDSAEQLDADRFFASFLDEKKGVVIRDGQFIETLQEAKSLTADGFKNLQEYKVDMYQQDVKVVSHDFAIYTGTGRITVVTNQDQTFDTDFASTIIFVLRDKEWKVLHAHQSVPDR